MSQYTTGTVTVTNGSPTVTGSGTTWSGNVTAGSVFTVTGSGVPYIVGSVDSNTQITLTSNYAASTLSGQSYSLTTSFTTNRKLPYMEQGDVDPATIHKRSMVQLDTLLGTQSTSGRVLYTSTDGAHVTDSGLTYNGTTFVAKSASFTATTAVLSGTLSVTGNGAVGGASISAWSAGNALEVGAAGTGIWAEGGDNYVVSNYYFNSGSKFAHSGYATYYLQVDADGSHRWYGSTASGTAGNAATMQEYMRHDGTAFYPGADNTMSCGTSGKRWSVVYAGTGTINTSDARHKTPVRSLTDAERAAAVEIKAAIGIFQFLDAVAEKGSDKARLHIGLTVQRAIEIMQGHGLDPFRYGFICYDSWDEEAIEHPAIEAADAQPAQPAEYETRIEREDAIVDGKAITIERPYLYCIKEAVPARDAIEAKPAWREVIRPAGEIYGFRPDELQAFILAAL